MKFPKDLWGEDIPFLSGLREKGRRAFAMPGAKTEAWKYSYFAEAELHDPVINTEPVECCGCHEQKENLPFEAVQALYCNGILHGGDFAAPEGVMIKSLAEAIFDGDAKKYLNKAFELNDFPFAALNTACLEQGLFVNVSRGARLSLYVHYRNHGAENVLGNIRNIVVAESGAEVVFTEDFEGNAGTSYTQNVVNEIYVGSGASVRHYVSRSESGSSFHIALNAVKVREGGSYNAFYAGTGGRFARHESFIRLEGENASATVNGVYRIDSENCVSDITTNIRHLVQCTSSDQLVKGVARASGKGVFQGQIHIAPGAQQSEGHQLHRALLIADGAEIDCKPELEIYADDVKCSHGAASGDLDKEQIFYMQSRGISGKEAEEILTAAYLDEVFAKNKDAEISDFIKQRFNALPQSGAERGK